MKPNRKSNPFLRTVTQVSTAAVVTVFSSSIVQAADITWNNTGTDFNAGASWTGAIAPTTTDRAVFAVAAVTSPALSAPATIQGLSFSTTASSGYTVSGSAITLTSTATGATSAINAANNVVGSTNTVSTPVILGGAAATTASFTQANNGTLAISGNISSTNAITGLFLQGNSGGSLVYTLSGNNTYSGTTQTGWVRVNLNSDTALSTGNLVVNNNVSLNNTSGSARTLANGITVSSPMTFVGVGAPQALTFGGAVAQNATITVTDAGTLTLNGAVNASTGSRALGVSNAGGLLTLGGVLNMGAFRTEKTGNGTLVLTQASTGAGLAAVIGTTTSYTSSMRLTGGTVVIPSQDALGGGADVDFRGSLLAGSVALTGANALTRTLVHATGSPGFGGTNNIESTGAYILNNGAGNQTLRITNTGTTVLSGSVSMTDHPSAIDNQTLTVNVDALAGAAEISGVIQNKTVAAFAGSVGKFIKAGAGALTLSGANTFSGGLDVTGGTLIATNVSALGASTNAISLTGTSALQFGGNLSYTIGGPLTVGTSAALRFGLTTTSGVNSKVTGTGTALYNGAFIIDLPLTNPPDGASWMISDPSLVETYGTSFVVSGWTGSAASGGWAIGTGTGVYTFKQATGVVTFAADSDGDGLPDAWEIAAVPPLDHNDPTGDNGADGDPDLDGFTNVQEFAAGSNPRQILSVPGDIDGDTLNDNWETQNFGNLLTGNVDSDGDGFLNKAEQDAGSGPNDSAWTPTKAKLAHRWSFNGSLNDSVGSSHATIVEVGANNVTLNADSVTLAGGTQATSDYVNLGPNLIGTKTAPVTVELWATQDAVKDWARIFSFGSVPADSIYVSWTRGTNPNQDRVEWQDNSLTSTLDDTNARYTLGTKYHIVMTLTPALHTGGAISTGTRVTWYRAAVGSNQPLWNQRGTFDTTNTLVTLNDINNYLGRSLGGDNTASATYDEVRLWNGAFTQNERTVSQAAGPNVIDLWTDSEPDGLPDSWETAYFGNTAQGDVDSDGDGEINSVELANQSNPNNILSLAGDVDADGLADTDFEMAYFGDLDENGAGDFDGDLATNEHEETAGTNPAAAGNWPDTEDFGAGDGLNDGWELFYFGDLDEIGTDDPDVDGEDNFTEQLAGTKPTDPLSRSVVPSLFTFIGPAARNGGFELLGPPPGTSGSTAQQIWDAAGANDVTYWTEWITQQTAQGNSGTLSSGTATEGTRRTFMQAGNAVYNLTEYIAAAGNTYWLAVDKVADNGIINFYPVYQDSGGVIQQIPGALLATSTTGNNKMLGFQIPGGSPAIGRRIGVGAHCPGGGNFPGMDNVRFGLQVADTDFDTYDDAFEDFAWGDNDGLVEASDLTAGPAGDVDGDGISSLNEINGTLNTAFGNAPTKANDSDSDDDGLSDGLEILTHVTNPNLADTDKDGLSDGAEINTYLTNPLVVDTDLDGFQDGVEVLYGSDPADFDSIPDLHKLVGLTKRNGSFETLNGVVSGAKASHWDTDSDGDVDNWTIWTEQSTASNDSGTEGTGSTFRDGAKHGYLQNGNAARNMTPYKVKAGDVIRLTYSRTTAGNLNAYLIVDTGAGIVQMPGTTVQLTNATGNGFELVFAVPSGHASIGQPLGIAFKSTGGYEGVDKVVLEVEDRDVDGDGLSDFWEDLWFGDANDDVVVGELDLVKGTAGQALPGVSDPDGDGFDNEAEETAGSNPNDTSSTPTDVDGDGLADIWETTYFGSTTAQNGSGDPDGDGTSNEVEFRLNLVPNDGTSRFASTATGVGSLTWPSVIGVSFKVERSTDLTTWTTLEATLAGTAGTRSYADPAPPAGKAFYKVTLNP